MSSCPSFSPVNRTTVFNSTLSPVTKQLQQKQNIRNAERGLIWGTVNAGLFAVTLYHLMNHCGPVSYLEYAEYGFALILCLNAFCYFIQYSSNYSLTEGDKPSSLNQSKKSQDLNESLNNSYNNVVQTSFSQTPMDYSAASWLSNTSLADSVYDYQSTPIRNMSPVYKSSPVIASNLSNAEVEDEKSLHEYLKDYNTLDTTQNLNVSEKPTSLLSYFWNHPSVKTSEHTSPLLKKCQYQLSATSSRSSSPKSDDKGSPLNTSSMSLDTWRRLNVDSVALMQWNENLRMWLSQTILSRLVNEFKNIDTALHNQGLSDISIGSVGLDRLRKTAQGPILQNVPSLPTIVPFLELHPNQEYLVRRIKDLAKGGCISEYKWNGGSSFNGKEWDASLPTDAAIIMHLTATYLDTLLLPLPSKPDVRPFSGYHFIKVHEKLINPNAQTLAIHEVSINPPHYRVIIGLETYEMVKGYNNLFHSILLFLYHVNEKKHGMLGGVNLGRSGVNMLWIIQSD